jgi:hypothetical protein
VFAVKYAPIACAMLAAIASRPCALDGRSALIASVGNGNLANIPGILPENVSQPDVTAKPSFFKCPRSYVSAMGAASVDGAA